MPRRDYSKYIITWNAQERKIIFRPKFRSAKVTPTFGLGNAKIEFNIDYPPKYLTKAITGDSDADGLLPNFPYRRKKWSVFIGGVFGNSIVIKDRNNHDRTIIYPQATRYKGWEMKRPSKVVYNHFGVEILRGIGGEYWALLPPLKSSSKYIAYAQHSGVCGINVHTRISTTSGAWFGLKDDGALESNIDISAVLEVIEQECLGSKEIVEIALTERGNSGCSLFVRTASGFGIEGRSDYCFSKLEVVNTAINVARVTREGFYYFKNRYFKSGEGDAGLVPLLQKDGEDIVSILETPFGDGVVILDGDKLFLKYRGERQELDRMVVGILDDGTSWLVVFEDEDGMFIEHNGSRIGVDDFGHFATFVVRDYRVSRFMPGFLLKNLNKQPREWGIWVAANGNSYYSGCWGGIGKDWSQLEQCDIVAAPPGWFNESEIKIVPYIKSGGQTVVFGGVQADRESGFDYFYSLEFEGKISLPLDFVDGEAHQAKGYAVGWAEDRREAILPQDWN